MGVSLETIYAYVSRGKIRSELVPGGGRLRRYRAEDVERLKQRRGYGRSPERGARGSLQWGLPVLDSALTAIADGALYYRGRNAVELADKESFAASAAWMWGVELAESPPFKFDDRPVRWDDAFGVLTTLQRQLVTMTAADPGAYRLRRETAAARAAAVIGIGAALAGKGQAVSLRDVPAMLAKAWCPRIKGARDLINGALILCIDHELNVSSFTARTVASAGASLYHVIDAGLCAFQGTRHGGQGLQVEAMMTEIEAAGAIARVLRERSFRGDPLSGFGHPLYPEGDPRARWILERIDGLKLPRSLKAQRELATEVRKQAGPMAPNIDFALAAMRRALGLPAHAAVTLFALGRIVGWAAHAIEQTENATLIRPRARYVGPPLPP